MISLEQDSIVPETDFSGTVTVNYNGRFDGVQINTYVTDTNEQVLFVEMNGRPISTPARLYVSRNEMAEKNSFSFKARIARKDFPKNAGVRLRAAIIQEHKEVESDMLLVPVSS